jgi:GNAT superfamily N-acetyltransferase
MMIAPVLRPGRDEDADGFIALIGACWAEYPGNVLDVDGELPELRRLASYFAGQGGALWAMEAGGQIVGMVATRPFADGQSWELCKMYASQARRGAGMAQTLIRTAEAHARANGATRMTLWTDTRFDRAHRFYEKGGYVRLGPLRVVNDKSNSVEFAYTKPLTGVWIERLDVAAAASAERSLALILQECVEAGASVSFNAPLPLPRASAYWREKARQVATRGRVLLLAWLDGEIAGTVTLDMDMPQNQPHRADLQKLLVRPSARRRGVARQLMERVEQEARAEGRNLLVLDTRTGDPAEQLYRSMGWQFVGEIPDFCRNADDTLSGTLIFWKKV